MANGIVKSASRFHLRQEQQNELSAEGYLAGAVDVLQRLPTSAIDEAVDALFRAYGQDGSVYLFGNGGSAALASHAACDLGKGTVTPGAKPFRVLSLTDNVALITAWANDTCYENIFSAQLQPLIMEGDIAFAISGSGNSPNVLNGLRAAREAGAVTIGLTGFKGGKMKPLCNCCIIVPSDNMQQIEDAHVCVMHAVYCGVRLCMGRSLVSRASAV